MGSMVGSAKGDPIHILREEVLSSSSVHLRCEELLRLAQYCDKEGINI